MWTLFIVAEVADFMESFFLKGINEAVKSDDLDKENRLALIYDEFLNVYLVTLTSAHWVFGIKYAEVVLKLPMLVFPEQVVDIKAKMNKISWVVWTLNGFFGALNFTYTILLQFYLYDDWNNMAVLLIGT